MNVYSNALLQVILVSYPLTIYLFYISNNTTADEKINNFLLDIYLFTSMYLLISYSNIIVNNCYLIINIPIVLAYLLNKKDKAIILSLIAIIFYHSKFQYTTIYLIIEYTIYYLIYLYYLKTKMTKYTFIMLFSIFGIFSSIILKVLTGIFIITYSDLLQFILLYVMSIFSFMLLEIGYKIRVYTINIKQIEKEKQIKNTIFKITHEIKNPLAVCKGYLQMINIDNKEQTEKYISNIKNEIDKTLILLQDFLSLNKIQINKDIIDINMLLEENLNVLKSYSKTKNTELEYNLIDDEIYVDGDYNRLGQVIINIIKNSIEAITKKPGKIKVYTKLDKKNVKIYFEDNGKGMSKERIKKIKEPFYSTKQNGCGLGIILSDEIISAHNGQLIYKSQLGKGTTTIIKLPIYKINQLL